MPVKGNMRAKPLNNRSFALAQLPISRILFKHKVIFARGCVDNTSSKTLIEGLVDSDQVHKSCYTSDEIFDQEIGIFSTKAGLCWAAKPDQEQGDFTTFQISRQPMILVRGDEGAFHVLFNRCPHRGAMLTNWHMGGRPPLHLFYRLAVQFRRFGACNPVAEDMTRPALRVRTAA